MARSTSDRSDRFWLGPLAGVAALLVLAGTYFALTRPRAPVKPANLLVPLTVNQISALTFTAQGKTLTLYQTAGTGGTAWHVGSPGGPAADTSLIGSFVGSLITLTPDRILTTTPTTAQLQAYGLSPAKASVAVVGSDGKLAVQLDVGTTSPLGSYYLQLAGKPTVYVVSGSVPAEISADPHAWLPPPTSSSGTSASGTSAASGTAPGSGTAASSASASTAASSSAATGSSTSSSAG